MTVVVRSVTSQDIDQLWDLIAQATYGLTTLQISKDQLTDRVELAEFAFKRKTEKPAGEPYVFVMEDLTAGKLVGTSCIFSKVGGYEPFYGYRIHEEEIHCSILHATRHVSSLHLEKVHDGPTEIGSLFLLPEYRGQGRGRLLSLARFAFIAAHPRRFSHEVIAEMRGIVHEAGTSPCWDAIARHFFQMDFPQADSLSTISKSFIEELMPAYPIYTCLLPESAREVMGGVHPQTQPAMAMLEAEGFVRTNRIDIFDGGPKIHCLRDHIKAVQRCRPRLLVDVVDRIDAEPVLLAHHREGFRAVIGPAIPRDDGITITEKAALQLRAKKGEAVWWMGLHPEAEVVEESGNESESESQGDS
ncbi:MAG: arginine N-succinyltransferase [Pirellulales bacterium]